MPQPVVDLLVRIYDYVTARLNEYSTWRGIALISTGVGIALAPQHWQAILAGGLSAVGSLGAFFPNGKIKKPEGE